MNIKTVRHDVESSIKIIERNDKSFNAKAIVSNLKRISIILNGQKDSQSLVTLFDKSDFKSAMRSLFPSNPMGFSGYYSPNIVGDEQKVLSNTQKTLSDVYDKMPTI